MCTTLFFFFSSRRRHTRLTCDWSSDVCSSDLELRAILAEMKRERVAFEALTAAARQSGQGLTHLMQPITDAQRVVTELQSRVKSLERLVPVLATLDEQTENVSKS